MKIKSMTIPMDAIEQKFPVGLFIALPKVVLTLGRESINEILNCTLLTLSFPESFTEISNVVLTFESVDEMLWCYNSNETTSAVLSLGTICFSIFCKLKFGVFLDFGFWTLLGVNGSRS